MLTWFRGLAGLFVLTNSPFVRHQDVDHQLFPYRAGTLGSAQQDFPVTSRGSS